jgi:hypothetical protein
MKEINQFTFYRNYYEIIKYLSPKDKLQLYDAILEYMFEDKEPELKKLLKGIWVNLKMPLDKNKTNINNGQKGGRPKTEEKPKDNPNKTQIKPNTEPKPKANNISYFLFLISNNNYKYIDNNNSIYNIVKEWLEYKQERKELYTEKGLQKLLTEIENNIDKYGEEKIIELISNCMASNYKGIIFEKLKKEQTYEDRRIKEWREAGEKFLRGE